MSFVRSLAFRLVVGAAVLLALGLAAGAVSLSGVFRDFAVRGFDERLGLQLDALIALAEAGPEGAVELARPLGDPRYDRAYSGWYWQIAKPEGPVLRSRSLFDAALPAEVASREGIRRRFTTEGPDGETVRVLTRVVTLPDAEGVFYFSAAGTTAEVEAEVAAFERTLAWSIAVLVALLVVMVVVQVWLGLAPLRRIPHALAAIRTGRAERLQGPFPSEVEPLARELNALLDHDREVVERARTHLSNLAHGLKTPLSVLANEAAASEGRLAETVERQTEAMRRQVDHHLARARAAARATALGAHTELAPVAQALARTLGAIHAGRGIAIDVEVPPGLAFRGERQDVEEMLGNLMDNGCKWARGRLRVAATEAAGRLTVAVEDDGPGLPEDARAQAIERGARLDETTPGSGMGLAIVRDLSALYGGTLTLEDSPMGGLRAVLTLPAGMADHGR